MRRIVTLLALMTVSVLPAFGQSAAPTTDQSAQPMEFKDLLYGNTIPLTLKLKDLNSDWRHISIGGSVDQGGGGLGALFGGSKATVYFTKGQTMNIAGATFIVAYKANIKQLDFMSLIMSSMANGGKDPDMSKLMPEKMTPDSPLALSMLNIRDCGTLSDIRPFDMSQEIADSANGGGGLADLMMLGMMADQNKKPSAGKATPAKAKKPR